MKKRSAVILDLGNKSKEKTKYENNTINPLSSVLFEPIINFSITNAQKSDCDEIIIITDFDKNILKEKIDSKIKLISLEDFSNTFHEFLSEQENDILFLNAYTPLLDRTIILNSYEYHTKNENNFTAVLNSEKTPIFYWCNHKAFNRLNISSSYDLLNTLRNQDYNEKNSLIEENTIKTIIVKDAMSLYTATKNLNQQIINQHMQNGVQFLTLDGILISRSVEIGKGTTILPSTILKGNTTIGENCTIGPNSLVENSIFANDIVFNASQCYNSRIEDHVNIGPFCHIRPNSYIKSGVKLGDFVEIKNSTLGEGTHVSHLTYVGDSDVGKNVNFGCGVVTVNYNGKTKNRCNIGDEAFIGCNTNLVAPVTIGYRGYTAAGSTITEDVPSESLAIARSRQTIKAGYNKK